MNAAHPVERLNAQQRAQLQEAVKERLRTLPNSVYEEAVLLEYTMVLIGNKKGRAQVAKDLEPFLQEHTAALVDWSSRLCLALSRCRALICCPRLWAEMETIANQPVAPVTVASSAPPPLNRTAYITPTLFSRSELMVTLCQVDFLLCHRACAFSLASAFTISLTVTLSSTMAWDAAVAVALTPRQTVCAVTVTVASAQSCLHA